MNCGPLSLMIRGVSRGNFSRARLDDDLCFRLGHSLADFPVDDEAAVAVEDRAEVVERAADVQVAEVDVPMVVRTRGLVEALAFAGVGRRGVADPAGRLQHAVDRGRADRHLIVVEHHERQPPIAFQRMLSLVGHDRLLLPILQPMVAWHLGVVLVGLAIAGARSRRTSTARCPATAPGCIARCPSCRTSGWRNRRPRRGGRGEPSVLSGLPKCFF